VTTVRRRFILAALFAALLMLALLGFVLKVARVATV
jgi:hypothetical protein